MPLSRVIASSTSSSSSVDMSAGEAGSRSAAQPTPTVPCGSSPERYATAIATSSGVALRRQVARRSIFASLDEVEATSDEASAISASSICVIQQLRRGEPDIRAAACQVRCMRRATMRTRDRGDDREPEPGPLAGAGVVGSREPLECPRQEQLVEAALVGHVQLDESIVLDGAQTHLSRAVTESVVDE